MQVQQLLDKKGSSAVETIEASATLREAANQLARKGIGCLVVINGSDQMCGILSERDIVRNLAKTGQGALSLPVSDAMTSNVVTCSPRSNDGEVLALMTQGRFRHIPVLDEGERVGLISIGDVVKARIEALERDYEALETMIRSSTG